MSSSTLFRHSVARSVFRPRQTVPRRYASSDSQKKSQEALASAQQNAGKLLEGVKKFLEPAGQKVGQLLGCTYVFLVSFNGPFWPSRIVPACVYSWSPVLTLIFF